MRGAMDRAGDVGAEVKRPTRWLGSWVANREAQPGCWCKAAVKGGEPGAMRHAKVGVRRCARSSPTWSHAGVSVGPTD